MGRFAGRRVRRFGAPSPGVGNLQDGFATGKAVRRRAPERDFRRGLGQELVTAEKATDDDNAAEIDKFKP